jgi:hypothetical protein
MYFEKKIFLLTKNQVEAIKDTTHNAAIMKMLDRIAHPEVPAVKNVTSSAAQAQQFASSPIAKQCPIPVSEMEFRDRSISEDDVTNLRIELELCSDSQAFIDRL